MMNLELFHEISQTRIPTPAEFVAFAHSQGWSIVQSEKAAKLRVQDVRDPLAIALAKMMSREPYRTNVLNVVRESDGVPPKMSDSDSEPHICPCGTWYCTKEEAQERVNASPHWCSRYPCPLRTTPKRNASYSAAR